MFLSIPLPHIQKPGCMTTPQTPMRFSTVWTSKVLSVSLKTLPSLPWSRSPMLSGGTNKDAYFRHPAQTENAAKMASTFKEEVDCLGTQMDFGVLNWLNGWVLRCAELGCHRNHPRNWHFPKRSSDIKVRKWEKLYHTTLGTDMGNRT